ncbi:MAG: globin-coupled sensor protein [Armatimonadetes bacterium]|nr:globin-coupled sensor protein [Armatimonadota bacterium]
MSQVYINKQVSSSEIQHRLSTNRIGPKDQAALRKVGTILTPHMNKIVDAFYDHVGKYPEALKIVTDAGATVERLKKTNPNYFAQMFAADFGPDYFASRLVIGKIHANIGLEPAWFYAAMSTYYDVIFPILVNKLKFQPGTLTECLCALQKAFNLDQSLILEAYIDGLVEEVDRVTSDTNESIRILQETSREIRIAADESGGAATQVAQVTIDLATGAQTQAMAADQAAESTAVLKENSQKIAEGSQMQAKALDKASAAVSEVQAKIHEIDTLASQWEKIRTRMEVMNQVKQTVTDTAARVEQMSAHSSEIGNIVQTIESIADQTNLLALNAAIEAARAGEHGRGFAVVAEEVRKLAERASDATKEISSLISTVQEVSSEANNFMTRTLGDVNEASEVSLEAASCLEQIALSASTCTELNESLGAAMVQVNGIADQNLLALREVDTNVEQTSGAIVKIATITQENSAASQEVSASAEEMSAQVELLAASIGQIDQQVDALSTGAAKLSVSIGKLRSGKKSDSHTQAKAA